MFERKSCYKKANLRIELPEQNVNESSNKTFLEISNFQSKQI